MLPSRASVTLVVGSAGRFSRVVMVVNLVLRKRSSPLAVPTQRLPSVSSNRLRMSLSVPPSDGENEETRSPDRRNRPELPVPIHRFPSLSGRMAFTAPWIASRATGFIEVRPSLARYSPSAVPIHRRFSRSSANAMARRPPTSIADFDISPLRYV